MCVVVVVVLFGGPGVFGVCVRVCLCVLRHAEKSGKPVCWFKNVPVCTIKTSPCMPAPRAHVLKHVRVVPVHTGTF